MALQSQYPTTMEPGLPGALVDMRRSALTYRNVEDAGGIAFGVPVYQGVRRKGITATGAAARFVGFTVLDRSATGLNGYQQYDEARVSLCGAVWVVAPATAVVGAPVIFAGVTLPGATYATAGAAGSLVVVEFVKADDSSPPVPAQPSVTISGSPTVTEGGTLAFVTTASPAPAADLVVGLSYAGSATRGSDYTALNTVTIPAGQVSAPITVTTIDDSAVESSETVVVSLVAGAGYTLGSTTSATGTITDNDAPPASQSLRYASSGNVVHNGGETQNKRGVQIRWPYVLGSGDLTELRILLDNWRLAYSTNQMINAGNTLPIQGASLELGGVIRPISFGGQQGVTLADGANDVTSDALVPADFGLQVFARGSIAYVKLLVMFDSASASFLCNSSARAVSQSGARVAWFDPTVTTSSDVYAAGQWSASGTAVASRSNGYVPKLIGRHASAAKVWITLGDSISQGTGDAGSTNRVAGLGWMSRATRDAADADTSQVAYMSMAVQGSASTLPVADARFATLAKYATHATVMYGTNDLGNNGTGTTLAVMQSRLGAVYSLLRSNGVQKILAGHLLPRTTTTDSWATEANQTYSGGTGGWDGTGIPAQLNAWLTSQVGSGVDAVQHWASIRGSDELKWLVNGNASYATTDGTHPTTATYGLMATDVRAQMAAL
ncbi:structural cement protein Gp24 [Xanthomonas vasicola]|uniref:structural cement protein Gp24 n=1 Tax=Xanthomonas vasicola TaxID=56459 RepID=UPI0020A01143|nr:GDSL-type esterase/lipase family protein [Xanthomonas vasicola]